MQRTGLLKQVYQTKSNLCVGLDTDPARVPKHLADNYQKPLLAFNQSIIAATAPYCIAYKINTAFYEALGSQGWELMEATIQSIPAGKFVIADAKRGDIGNTAAQYARAFFELLNFDAITLSPYMGRDAILPFLDYPDKAVIVLALTSNDSASDFQYLTINDRPMYQQVLAEASTWADQEKLMFVVGATKAEELKTIRGIYPHHSLLVPGIGSQGGSLEAVMQHGLGPDLALMVNVSRDILYQSSEVDFAEAAGSQAASYQHTMQKFL